MTNLLKSQSPTCLLIDALALIQAIGKPEKTNSFGDLADVFLAIVTGKFGKGYSRVDVLFDRYLQTSIKDGSRSDRAMDNVIAYHLVTGCDTTNQFSGKAK